MLNLKIIKAITLDLDDTLWPVWPAIQRAEKALGAFLNQHAPKTAALFADPSVRNDIRSHIMQTQPGISHDLSAVRLQTIRVALNRTNENALLAEAGFEVFYAERNRVDLFHDAIVSLEFLSARFPVVALSNGNADIERIGLKPYFRANINAQAFGLAKPDARIFHAAASAVDVSAAQVLHVGDDASLDVLGALNAGMQTAWLNRDGDAWPHAESPHITVTSLTQLCDYLGAAEPHPA